jgi:hypothetical protein
MHTGSEQQYLAESQTNLEMWKKTVFEQRWLHARHVETVRSALLGVYAAIVSGCLTTLKGDFYKKPALPLYVFLMILTLIWLLLCIKLGDIFQAHTEEANKLIPDGIPKMLPLFKAKHRISIRRLIRDSFVLCFTVLFLLSTWIWFHA